MGLFFRTVINDIIYQPEILFQVDNRNTNNEKKIPTSWKRRVVINIEITEIMK